MEQAHCTIDIIHNIIKVGSGIEHKKSKNWRNLHDEVQWKRT
nr:MAG TPA: hypothetical protein [Caudoviricetes sp.]